MVRNKLRFDIADVVFGYGVTPVSLIHFDGVVVDLTCKPAFSPFLFECVTRSPDARKQVYERELAHICWSI
jgi:hypothetical protein